MKRLIPAFALGALMGMLILLAIGYAFGGGS
jgi:hypothetical protein